MSETRLEGVEVALDHKSDKMKFYVLAALVSAASAGVIYPAGVDPVACPNYPYCSVDVPAALPTPVVRGQPVAPVLNTVPEQTAYYQQAQVVTAPAALPTPIINGQPVAPVLNTAQNLLQQQIDQQTIQIRAQQQQIEAERHFG